tara:strand:- start:171 stop:485 length:315 start_codon:yes stop_codon:yes gene_type:complete
MDEKTFRRRTWSIIVVGCIAIGSFPYVMDSLRLTECDDAIRATLKAPSTYQRVYYYREAPDRYRITYEASNSFGVPIEKTGQCNLDKRFQTWKPEELYFERSPY